MKSRGILSILVIMMALALVAGCSDTSSPAGSDFSNNIPDDDDYAMIAEDIAYAITDPVDGLIAMWAPNPPQDFPGDPGDPQIDHRDFSQLRDTTFTHRGFTTTIDVTFFDAEDNTYEVYDPETSVRMSRELTMEGGHYNDFRQVEVELYSFLTMDNILATDTVHVINDTGSRSEIGEMQGRWRDHFQTWDALHDWESTDINIHVDHENHPYPLSGSVYHHTLLEKTMTNGHTTRTFTLEVGSTTTFDGTNWALVVMDNGDQFMINLDNGRSHRRPRP
ncbi:MAG TPA: hypothetical protein ENH10_09180 [Bacteroidetes bacterium]|nr:hypothetical protein [Bacteroidota bacterium]HEX05307.1 hypothetical protein [Bacteroidota bacterium]